MSRLYSRIALAVATSCVLGLATAFAIAHLLGDIPPPPPEHHRPPPPFGALERCAPDDRACAAAHLAHAGDHRPPPPPPFSPDTPGFFLRISILVLIMAALSVLLVGLPLARRLRRFHDALEALGEGRLDLRLVEDTGGFPMLRDRINATASRLESIFGERTALLQAVSHELGTPLSRLRIQVAMLREATEDPDVAARLDAIREELEELESLAAELIA